MPRLRRRMVKAKIRYISLCPAGRNLMPVVYKSDDADAFELSLLAKELSDQGEIHACVYAPDLVDYDGEAADEAVIKEAAYGFLRDGGEIDIRHDEKPVPRDQAYVAESFLIQKGDARFADMKDRSGRSIDVAGGWGVVIKIENPELREKYRTGEWSGVSMGGRAQFQDVSIYDTTRKSQPNTPTTGELNMDEEKLAEVVTKGVMAGLKADREAEAARKAAAEEEAAKNKVEKGIPFEGDPTNAEDVRKHLAKVEAAKIDWNDPEAVRKHLDKVSGNTPKDPKQARIEELEKELRGHKGGSNQGAGSGFDPNPEGEDEITKAMNEAHQTLVEAGVRKADEKPELPFFFVPKS